MTSKDIIIIIGNWNVYFLLFQGVVCSDVPSTDNVFWELYPMPDILQFIFAWAYLGIPYPRGSSIRAYMCSLVSLSCISIFGMFTCAVRSIIDTWKICFFFLYSLPSSIGKMKKLAISVSLVSHNKQCRGVRHICLPNFYDEFIIIIIYIHTWKFAFTFFEECKQKMLNIFIGLFVAQSIYQTMVKLGSQSQPLIR